MQTVTWTCDCGCGEKATGEYERQGWFTLSQQECRVKRVSLSHVLHFVNLFHLTKWAKEAEIIGTRLEKSEREGPQPSGLIKTEGFPSLCI